MTIRELKDFLLWESFDVNVWCLCLSNRAVVYMSVTVNLQQHHVSYQTYQVYKKKINDFKLHTLTWISQQNAHLNLWPEVVPKQEN